VERVLDRTPAVTAIMGFHRGTYDAIAHVALRRGIRVPQDLSVAYFATPWQLVISDYRPTALELPEAQIAVAAVRQLLDQIEGRETVDDLAPIPGTLRPGWTTSPPGQPWAGNVNHCDHVNNHCLYAERMEHWANLGKGDRE